MQNFSFLVPNVLERSPPVTLSEAIASIPNHSLIDCRRNNHD
ncbi:hypothetical protein [Nostoc sp. CALU 546]